MLVGHIAFDTGFLKVFDTFRRKIRRMEGDCFISSVSQCADFSLSGLKSLLYNFLFLVLVVEVRGSGGARVGWLVSTAPQLAL